jgi:hypothetical protein
MFSLSVSLFLVSCRVCSASAAAQSSCEAYNAYRAAHDAYVNAPAEASSEQLEHLKRVLKNAKAAVDFGPGSYPDGGFVLMDQALAEARKAHAAAHAAYEDALKAPAGAHTAEELASLKQAVRKTQRAVEAFFYEAPAESGGPAAVAAPSLAAGQDVAAGVQGPAVGTPPPEPADSSMASASAPTAPATPTATADASADTRSDASTPNSVQSQQLELDEKKESARSSRNSDGSMSSVMNTFAGLQQGDASSSSSSAPPSALVLQYMRHMSDNLVPADCFAFRAAFPGQLMTDTKPFRGQFFSRAYALVHAIDSNAVAERTGNQELGTHLKQMPPLAHFTFSAEPGATSRILARAILAAESPPYAHVIGDLVEKLSALPSDPLFGALVCAGGDGNSEREGAVLTEYINASVPHSHTGERGARERGETRMAPYGGAPTNILPLLLLLVALAPGCLRMNSRAWTPAGRAP